MAKFNEILDESSMLGMLQECTESFKAMNLDLNEDADWRAMIEDPNTRKEYTQNLAEGLNDKDAAMFEKLSENIAEFSHLNEANTTAGFLPQAKLVMPLFRFMWPKLVAKELVNVIPMDSPEIVRYFFRPQAKDAFGNVVNLPSYESIGGGTKFGTFSNPQILALGSKINIFDDAIAKGLVPADFDVKKGTLTREVVLTNWYVSNASGGVDNTGPIKLGHVDEEGKFSVTVEFADGISVISGRVDFRTGDFVATVMNTSPTATNNITHVGVVATILTSEYNQATKISFDPKKIRFATEDMELQAEWSIQWEQDQKARMGLDVQAEFISVFGNQIQLNIDNLILNDIVSGVERFNTANIQQFHRTPQRANFAGTLKRYAEELLLYIEQASANIYNVTSLMPANYLAINPKDLVWLKMLNGFDYKGGDYGKDGTLGSSPIVGTFQNTYTVLSSPIIPSGKIIVAQKPSQESFAGYIYAPYVPISLMPWPMGPRPAMTVMSRFARKLLKPECYGIIEMVN